MGLSASRGVVFEGLQRSPGYGEKGVFEMV